MPQGNTPAFGKTVRLDYYFNGEVKKHATGRLMP